ncbi:MAG: type I secretion system permease/ATPase [Desulfobacteraceae bacterium]|jgi:PrtD family type I secretion system ABC transporter|nr:type I secretion system permease/ATPase [Desulfobacteraceae bacterium]
MRKFLKKWMKYFLFAGFFSLFINLLALTFPIYMLAIYDRVLTSHSLPTLITISIGAVFALLVLGILDFFRSRLLVKAGVDMDKTLSRPVMSEMLKASCRINKSSYTEGLKDINILRNYFAGNAIFGFFDAPWTPLYIIVIYLMHPILGLFALCAALLLFLLGLLQELLTRKRSGMADAIAGQERNFISTSMRNAEVIRAMGMTDGIKDHWKGLNREVMILQTQANRFAGALNSVSKSFRPATQVLIYGLGAYLVLQNESTAGVIIAASIIMRQALNPVEQLMNTWRQTVTARGAYKRIDDLIKSMDMDEKMELPPPEGQLTLEGVTLGSGEKIILNNISFSLSVGEQLGLIGPSGSGKTTLCRLMLGIWAAAAGTVRLDGADVFKWDKNHLGPYVGYLPQEIEFFSGTISENIARMGDVDPEKVISAAQMSGIHEMILKLGNGYDTQIGDHGGIRLSGGQRQRVAMARALYGEPKLIVLDEPNSNLDDAGEQALLKALAQLKELKITTIIVTHKPSLLNTVDKVLMLQDGQVANFGPKEEVFSRLLGSGKPAVPPIVSGAK